MRFEKTHCKLGESIVALSPADAGLQKFSIIRPFGQFVSVVVRLPALATPDTVRVIGTAAPAPFLRLLQVLFADAVN